jgi:carnosine synthase
MAFSIVKDALGFVSGVFHVEAKYITSGYPRLIEVNCRMGGGPIRAVHLARSGVDLVTEQLLLAAGLPTRPALIPVAPCVGFIDVNARRSGQVGSVDILHAIITRPNMVYCKPLVAPNQHIIGPEEGQPSWLAEAVFLCDTPQEAASQARDLYEEIQVLFECHYLL